MKATVLCLFVAVSLICGCGFAHDEQLTGPYRLLAVDTLDQMSVSFGLPSGDALGRISETVFSVGWNDRYIVAKQHPNNNRSITHFYYLDISRDKPHLESVASVTGPLTESEFLRIRQDLGLPEFTRTIESLK